MKQSITVAATLLLCTLLVAGCGASSESTQDNASSDNREVIEEGTVAEQGATIDEDIAAEEDTAAEADLSSFYDNASTQQLAKATTTSATTAPAPGGQNALPFNKVPRSRLAASKKKIFAHYFTPFPLSISNKTPQNEYYRINYMDPMGENGKFLDVGGYLRQKPLDRAVIPTFESYHATDMRHEVRLAASMGIDGFAVDILSDSGTQWERVLKMLDIAHEEFPNFSILLMPDMMSLSNPDKLVGMIKQLAQKPAAYRAEDGRLIIAPYRASNQTPQWWARQLQTLKSNGINAVLLPVFPNWRKGMQDFVAAYPTTYKNMLYGVSDWGPRTATGAAGLTKDIAEAKQYGIKWMSPVAPQDMRPKSSKYMEASNSETLRRSWLSAIEGNADWVQIITWNDYSEATEVAPSTRTHYAFYDLVTYYATWFKVGKPAIVRDTLYAFYREHSTHAPFVSGAVQSIPMQVTNADSPRNEIEMVAFLKEPGTLQIEIAGKIYRKEAAAGVTSFKVPLQPGKPAFKLLRNGALVKRMDGAWNIKSAVSIQNLIYNGMSSRRPDPANNTTAVTWPWRYGKYTDHQELSTLLDGTISPFVRTTNLDAIRYTDNTGDISKGVGFSFLSPGTTSRSKVVFDVRLDNLGRSSDMVVALANSAGTRGTSISLKAATSNSLSISEDSYSGNAIVRLPFGRWHRVEMTVTELAGTGDRVDIMVTDSLGNRKTLLGTDFTTNIDDIARLLFLAETPKSRLLIDNVSVRKL